MYSNENLNSVIRTFTNNFKNCNDDFFWKDGNNDNSFLCNSN